MSRRIALWAAIVLTLIVIGAEAWLAPRMTPTPARPVDEFWAKTLGILRPGRDDSGLFHAIAIFDDGWYVCRANAMDAPDYFRVSEADVAASFPAVERELERRAATQPADSDNPFIIGYRTWRSDPKKHAKGIIALLDQTERDFQIALTRKYPETNGLVALDRYLLEQHKRQDKWRWATVAFDAGYLIALIWFATWPVLRCLRPWRWGLHWGLIPLLFFLPAYLGFVGYTFTGYGPSGGVIYPWLLYGASTTERVCTTWDLTIMHHLPQVLEPLAQVDGSWLDYFHGYGVWGPTAAISCGAAIGLVTFMGRWWIEKWHDRARAKLTG